LWRRKREGRLRLVEEWKMKRIEAFIPFFGLSHCGSFSVVRSNTIIPSMRMKRYFEAELLTNILE
jgi:hypothetical protein